MLNYTLKRYNINILYNRGDHFVNTVLELNVFGK